MEKKKDPIDQLENEERKEKKKDPIDQLENEERKEKIEETLDELEKVIGAEAEGELQKIDSEIPTEGPITLYFKNKNIEQEINNLKELTESGVIETSKNVIIFYKHASKAGDRVRGLVFLLLGGSILLTGLFATSDSVFTIKELLSIINTSLGGYLGRVLIVVIGVSLAAYGLDKMMGDLWHKIFPKKPPKQKYVQKKLT